MSDPLPRVRSTPEDFRVEEVPLSRPEGSGEHLYLLLEKRGRDTEAVAKELAQLAGVSAAEVGFAGRKDRKAVTRQWFSVPRVRAEEAREWELEGCEVLEAHLGRHRLRLGELQGNRFEIVVRDLEGEAARRARDGLSELGRVGCPNLFGAQRFGRRGDNARLGAALLRGEAVGGGRRHQRFLISALQAAVFNEVLRQRPWPYFHLVPGDLAFHHLSGRLEPVRGEEAGSERLEAFRVSPSGPLFGSKMRAAGGAVKELEDKVLAGFQVESFEPRSLPRGLRLYGERRPLRMVLKDASAELWEAGLVLRFTLPPGGFATTVLDQLLPGGYRQ